MSIKDIYELGSLLSVDENEVMELERIVTDVYGRVHEHWADSDTLNAEYETRYIPADEGLKSQWGEPAPMEFINHVSP